MSSKIAPYLTIPHDVYLLRISSIPYVYLCVSSEDSTIPYVYLLKIALTSYVYLLKISLTSYVYLLKIALTSYVYL